MPISVQCDQCGKTLKVPDTAAGKRGKCPCGAILVIPAAGGIQTAPARAPAPAAAPPPRRSAAPPSVSRGEGGAVTPPATFKKLFTGYLVCLVLSFVVGLVFALIMAVFVGSTVSSAGKSVEEQQKYQDALTKHFVDVNQWETGGQVGPKPQAPAAPKAMEAPSGMGGGIFMMVLGYGVIMVLSVAAAVFLFMFVYKAWDLIQDGHPSTTPLMAVLLLLVPFFNIYWIFVAYWGLAKDLNTYAREQGVEARPASEGMVLWGLILSLLGCTAPVGYILVLLGFNSIKNTCMDIAAAKAG